MSLFFLKVKIKSSLCFNGFLKIEKTIEGIYYFLIFIIFLPILGCLSAYFGSFIIFIISKSYKNSQKKYNQRLIKKRKIKLNVIVLILFNILIWISIFLLGINLNI